VADYSVNLELAIKGAKDLQRTRVETKRLQKEIDILNKRARLQFPATVKNFNNLSKEVGRAHRAVSEAAIGTDHYRVAIKNAVKVEEQFNKQQSIKKRLFKIERLAYKESITFSQAKTRVIQEEIKAENELAKAKLRSSGIGAGIRRGAGSAIGSGIIGGGFPLLFGQGPLAAAAGGIGGFAGGALAAIPGMGQFGFALSIAGTAIGSAMEDLTEALKKPEENIENLVNKLGLVGTPTADLALRLEKVGANSSAARLLLDKFNEKMGKSPEELLETTKKLEEFKNKVNELGTEITLFLSSVLIPFIEAIGGALDTGKLLRMLEDKVGKKEKFRIQQEIVNKANIFTDSIIRTNKAMGIKPEKTRSQMLTEFIDLGLKQALGLPVFDQKTTTPQAGGTKPPGSDLATQTFQDREIVPLKQALEIEQKRLSISGEKLTLMKEEFELTNLQKKLDFFINEEKQFNNGLHDETIQKLKAEVDLQKQVVQNAERLVKGKAFAENVLKPQMDALAAQEQEEFDAGAALGKRLAAEVKTINNLDKEIQKMGLLTELEEAKTVEEKANIQFKLLELDLGQQIHDVNKTDILNLIKKKEGLIENNRLLKEQKQIAKDLNYTFAVEMSTAIKGLITGANSLNDAFRNVLNKMADAFLNIGLFGNVAGNLIGGKGLLGTLFSGFLANGGPAKAGKSYIVGERGPEMFTPGVTGTVTPNHALGGSTNIVVNVDASGSNVEGDEEQGRELGRMISVAIQSELIKQKRPGGMLA